MRMIVETVEEGPSKPDVDSADSFSTSSEDEETHERRHHHHHGRHRATRIPTPKDGPLVVPTTRAATPTEAEGLSAHLRGTVAAAGPEISAGSRLSGYRSPASSKIQKKHGRRKKTQTISAVDASELEAGWNAKW